MVRLPSPNDISLVTPQARGANSVQAIQAQETQPNLVPGRVLGDLGEMVYKESQKIDSLKAEEALNEIRQARLDLTMGEQGAYSVKGGGVVDPTYASGYKARIGTSVEGIMSRLTPAQQARLKPHADREVMGFQTDVLRHSMAETAAYQATVEAGSLSTKASVGIAQWDDAIAFTGSVAELRDTVRGIAKRKGIVGKDDAELETIAAAERAAMSPMFVGAITKALDSKTPEGLRRAEELFAQGGQAIDPNAQLVLGKHLQEAKEAHTVQTAAAEELSLVTQINTPVSRLAGAMSGAIRAGEAGRQPDYTGGEVLRGPKITNPKSVHYGDQAVGEYQIMPKVAPQDAKEAGLPWREDLFYAASEEGRQYREKLHLAHVRRIIRVVGNDPVAVAAAYNAGERAVLEAQKKWAAYKAEDANAISAATGADRKTSFLSFLPEETQKYVPKVIAAYTSAPDVVRPSERDIAAKMRNKFPDRPDLVARATQAAVQQLDLVEKARKDEIENAKEEAYKRMGQPGVTYDSLPVSLTSKLPVREQDAMKEVFTQHLAKTPRDSDPTLLSLYNSDPQALKNAPTGDWGGALRMQLSEYDWQRLDKQRSLLRSGDVKDASGLNSGAIHNALRSRLAMLDIHPKASDKKATMIENSARAVLDEAVLNEQARLGRRLTDTETLALVDQQFRDSVKLKNTFNFMPTWLGGGGTTEVAAMQMGYSDIPSDVLKALKAHLAALGNKNPTDVQLLTLFKQNKRYWKPEPGPARGEDGSVAPGPIRQARATTDDDMLRGSF